MVCFFAPLSFLECKFHLHHLHLGAPFPTPWRKIPPRWPPPGRSSALSPFREKRRETPGVLSTPVLNLHRFLGETWKITWIFNPGFPWNSRWFSLLKFLPFGEVIVLWGTRYNLTKWTPLKILFSWKYHGQLASETWTQRRNWKLVFWLQASLKKKRCFFRTDPPAGDDFAGFNLYTKTGCWKHRRLQNLFKLCREWM